MVLAQPDSDIPPTLALVREFVNSVEWQVDVDSWQNPSDLADWLAAHTPWERHDLDADDLDLARRLREGLRCVLLMHAGHEPISATVDDLNAALHRLPLRMNFDATAEFGFVAAGGTTVANPLAHVLEAVDTARADGSWSRLKACSRDSCRWAYWDHSRNRSGRWCSMAGCGNYVKMRRRNGASPEAVIDDSGLRAPTLVDVAGRAGVSIKTVSNVVTGTVHVADQTRARVEAAIKDLDYRPNLAARSLAKRRARELASGAD
ncbi:MAG: LacI family DNA-binding transcriptional regulator [Mycetocola sp.]